MLEKLIPDLILLDVNMPEMNGYETIKILKSKKETKDIPVIFLAAQTDDGSEIEGLSLGAVDYITKQEFLEHAKIFAVSHHEKWDGSGYPKGLKGEEIPLQGRIMAIADVYDALVSDRPYKIAFSHEDAVKIISDGKGIHFDSYLTDLFVEVADKFDEIRKLSRSK